MPLLSQDAYARGEVFIGSKENSYTVLAGLPPSTQGYHWNHGITIVTPDRKFLFACETEAEQRDWIAAFQRVINRPMRPQEYAGTWAVKLIQCYGKFWSCHFKWIHTKVCPNPICPPCLVWTWFSTFCVILLIQYTDMGVNIASLAQVNTVWEMIYSAVQSLRNKIRRNHLHFAATRKHFSLFVVLSRTVALIQKHHYCHSERAGCSGAYSVTCIIALPLYYSSSLQWRPISNTSLEAYRKPQPTPEELQKPVSVRSETNPCVWPQTMAGQSGVGLGDKLGYFGMSKDGRKWLGRQRYSVYLCVGNSNSKATLGPSWGQTLVIWGQRVGGVIPIAPANLVLYIIIANHPPLLSHVGPFPSPFPLGFHLVNGSFYL